MSDIHADQVRIDAGASVVIVGFTANAPFDRQHFCRTMPDIVLAGRLMEPHGPGQALLLAPGPMAGSVSPRGFAFRGVRGPSGAFVVLRHRHHDARGAYLYAAIEDTDPCDAATLVEVAGRSGFLGWPDILRVAKAVVQRAAFAYRQLGERERITLGL